MIYRAAGDYTPITDREWKVAGFTQPRHPKDWPIRCESCGKEGTMKDVQTGWRLAPNKIGAYVCSQECDRIFIEANKRSRGR